MKAKGLPMSRSFGPGAWPTRSMRGQTSGRAITGGGSTRGQMRQPRTWWM